MCQIGVVQTIVSICIKDTTVKIEKKHPSGWFFGKVMLLTLSTCTGYASHLA